MKSGATVSVKVLVKRPTTATILETFLRGTFQGWTTLLTESNFKMPEKHLVSEQWSNTS